MKLLRDPLTHFVVAATLIFVAYSAWQTKANKADATIVVTTSQMERLAALYTAEAGALPTDADMAAMVTDLVRDEALSREARRLGLDLDDTIITRRLSQKMSFVVSDMADVAAPSDDVLRAWHVAHSDRFTSPATVTFSHIYFSPDLRGPRMLEDAQEMLEQLTSPSAVNSSDLGDPFMLQRQYGEVPIREVAQQFGGEFAASLADMPPSDIWQGPISSAFGVHLVQLSSAKPASVIPFNDIAPQVRNDWLDEARRQANEQAIQKIVDRYTVEVEGFEGSE